MGWHAWTAIRLGMRRRTLLLILVLGLLVVFGGALFGEFSGRQPATVAVGFALSAFRVVVLLLALFWIQELFGKELEQGTLHTVLSLPQPRYHYLLGRFLGVAGLVAGTLLLYSILLVILGWLASAGYSQATPIQNGWPVAAVMAYLGLDLVTVMAFALFMATLSTTPMLPLALGLAFAWASRALGPVLAYLLEEGKERADLRGALAGPVQDLQWVLPDLSRLDIRAGLLYGQWPSSASLIAAAAMALGYTAILLALAIWRFNTRELG